MDPFLFRQSWSGGHFFMWIVFSPTSKTKQIMVRTIIGKLRMRDQMENYPRVKMLCGLWFGWRTF